MNGIIPIPTEPIPVLAVPPFLAGLIYGMTTEDHLLEITDCYVGAEVLFPELNFALDRVHTGGIDNDI